MQTGAAPKEPPPCTLISRRSAIERRAGLRAAVSLDSRLHVQSSNYRLPAVERHSGTFR